MTTDFTHLDELLFEAIEQQPMDFNTLRAKFEGEFDKHAKAGRIEFAKKQWHAAGKGRLL
jgi:hypothetical protein